MFKKLNRNIIRYILILTTSFFLVISALTAYYFINFIEADFKVKVEDNFDFSINNFNFQRALLETNFTTFIDNNIIIEYAKTQDDTQETLKRLDALVYSSDLIAGATIYGQSILSSSNVSNVPTLDELTSIDTLSTFIASTDSSIIFDIRTKHIASSFGYTAYDQSFGIASYFIKITDANNTDVGVLEIDLDSEFIYKHFFNYGSSMYLDSSICFVSNKSNYLVDSANNHYDKHLENIRYDNFYLKNDYYIKTKVIDQKNNIVAVMLIPTSVISYYKTAIIFSLVIIDLGGIFIAFIIIKILSRKTINSLINLYQKIESSENEFKPLEH